MQVSPVSVNPQAWPPHGGDTARRVARLVDGLLIASG
jgi:hypothetical protein